MAGKCTSPSCCPIHHRQHKSWAASKPNIPMSLRPSIFSSMSLSRLLIVRSVPRSVLIRFCWLKPRSGSTLSVAGGRVGKTVLSTGRCGNPAAYFCSTTAQKFLCERCLYLIISCLKGFHSDSTASIADRLYEVASSNFLARAKVASQCLDLFLPTLLHYSQQSDQNNVQL